MIRTWRFDLHGKRHEVTLEQTVFWREVRLNGRKIIEEPITHNLGGTFDFPVDDAPCRLVIGRSYLVWNTGYTFAVNGQEVQGIKVK